MKKLVNIIKSNKFLVLFDQGLYSAASFISTLFFAHLLSAGDFGIFSSIVLINFLMISISNALVIQPFQVNSAGHHNKAYTGFTLSLQLIILIIILLTLYLISTFQIVKDSHLFFFQSFLLSAGLILHDFFRKFFLAQNKIRYTIAIDALAAISLVFVMGLLWFRKNTSLTESILFSSFVYIPSVLYSFIKFNWRPNANVQWFVHLKTHLSQGKWLLFVSVLQWASGNLFTLMSGLIISMEALGALRLVQSLFGVLNILLQTFENYVLPQATRLYHQSVTASKTYLKSVSIKATVLFLSVLIILCIFPKSIINLAGGHKYNQYAFVVQGISILYFIISIGYPVRLSIRMLILNKSFFAGYLISFLFSVASYHFLIHRWQLSGVIFGLIMNQLITLAYWQFQLNKNKFYLWK